MKIKLTIAILCFFSPTTLFAEQATNEKIKTQPSTKEKLVLPKIALIGLGPIPPRRYREPTEKEKASLGPGAENIPELLAPPPYSTAPSRVFYLKSKDKDKKKWAYLSVAFNQQALPKTVPVEKALTLYRSGEKSREKKAYFKIPPLKANTQTLFFLTPSSPGQTPWLKAPKMLAAPLIWPKKGKSKLLFVNTSNRTVMIQIGSRDIFTLKKGLTKSFLQSEPEKKIRVQVTAKGKKDSKIAIQDSIRFVDGLLRIYAFYEANPETNGGKNLGVFTAAYDRPEPKQQK